MVTIADLHKNDKFIFNGLEYTVKRKWINDDKPLIAWSNYLGEERFYHEGLEIEKVD